MGKGVCCLRDASVFNEEILVQAELWHFVKGTDVINFSPLLWNSTKSKSALTEMPDRISCLVFVWQTPRLNFHWFEPLLFSANPAESLTFTATPERQEVGKVVTVHCAVEPEADIYLTARGHRLKSTQVVPRNKYRIYRQELTAVLV